ncbi:OmpP1/FadL family transporter [Phocaeicola barnesiae]
MSSNKALFSALFIMGAVAANAQASTNSPYTRYGLGELSDQAFAHNAAMGGIGYALRSSEQINVMNPASYSAVDSLSFMFDIGMGLKSSNYQENGYKTNAKNASFDYLAMQFRLHPRVGFAVGFTPYSNVGYKFSRTSDIENSDDVTLTNTFYGDGGLQQIFGGIGFKILDNLSIGANVGYLYGEIDYQTLATLSNGGDQTTTYNNISINSYIANFGLQYTQKLSKTDKVTLGLVYGLGHDLKSTETKGIQVTDGSSYSELTEETIKDSYGIPSTFGAGLTWQHKQNLTVGADYTLQQFENVKYDNSTDFYKNRTRIGAGIEYMPSLYGRNYLSRIRYRAGAYYSSSYMKLPEYDGPKEWGVSAGFGLPLHLFQRNTVLSITGQYVRVLPSVKGMLSENRFVLKLGLTFNEHWFMKWRVN